MKTNDITALLLLGFIIFIWADWKCGSKNTGIQPAPIITIERDTLRPIVINLPPGKSTVIYQPIPADIDSFQIAQAYFATVNYQDTIRTDSVQVIVNEVVSRNAIQSRQVSASFLFPTSTTVTEIHQAKLRNKLLVGAALQYNENLTVVPTIGMMDKNGRLFTVGYNPVNRGYQVGAMITIKLKK